jgi:hypothetical protein
LLWFPLEPRQIDSIGLFIVDESSCTCLAAALQPAARSQASSAD